MEYVDASQATRVVGHVVVPPATDTYFQGEPGLIATFDLDYDSIIDFNTKVSWAAVLSFPPFCIMSSFFCVPCFLQQNVEWKARSQHVALTRDGIRYVREKHKTWCGLPFSDKGKESKTVPYDKITDCDVQEPAGAACCCFINRVLSEVHVDTASSGPGKEGHMHELELSGLRYANEFKLAVWAIKRGEVPENASMPKGPRAEQLAAAPLQDQMSTHLLTEIRDELRQLNATMRQAPPQAK
ncbi:unnamed protein product [Polarella glacialis]|uniref:Uncharacterized protein n=1 Tax=Polarella glacialis TaxID=89957 RepID=A0A813F4S2_POLGL|nr:unnamed protein product [Polarella glacialis]CAE8710207.1 unnamed protein product [Polarella glacialis]